MAGEMKTWKIVGRNKEEREGRRYGGMDSWRKRGGDRGSEVGRKGIRD